MVHSTIWVPGTILGVYMYWLHYFAQYTVLVGFYKMQQKTVLLIGKQEKIYDPKTSATKSKDDRIIDKHSRWRPFWTTKPLSQIPGLAEWILSNRETPKNMITRQLNNPHATLQLRNLR